MTDEKALLKTLLGSNTVRYYPALAKAVGGATTALMLSQLLYWVYNETMSRKLSIKDGWFFINCEEMENQTGLTANEQRTARDKLIKLGIIEISYKGRAPRTTHYRINIEAISMLFQSSEKPTTGNVDDQSSGNQPASGTENVPLMDGKTAHFNTDTTQTLPNITTEARRVLFANNEEAINVFRDVAKYTPSGTDWLRAIELVRDVLRGHEDFDREKLKEYLKTYADDWTAQVSKGTGRKYSIRNLVWLERAAAGEALFTPPEVQTETPAVTPPPGGIYV